jgi:hypothetical protein
MQRYKGRMWPAGRISIIAGLIRKDLFRNTKIIGVFFLGLASKHYNSADNPPPPKKN